jgi:hypothetical protein
MEVADGHDPFNTIPDAGDLVRGQGAAEDNKESPDGKEDPRGFSSCPAGRFFAASNHLHGKFSFFPLYPRIHHYTWITSFLKHMMLSSQASNVKNRIAQILIVIEYGPEEATSAYAAEDKSCVQIRLMNLPKGRFC